MSVDELRLLQRRDALIVSLRNTRSTLIRLGRLPDAAHLTIGIHLLLDMRVDELSLRRMSAGAAAAASFVEKVSQGGPGRREQWSGVRIQDIRALLRRGTGRSSDG